MNDTTTLMRDVQLETESLANLEVNGIWGPEQDARAKALVLGPLEKLSHQVLAEDGPFYSEDNATLRDQVAELERENKDLSDDLYLLEKTEDELKDHIKILEAQLTMAGTQPALFEQDPQPEADA